jgi:hypothetical protein
VVAINIATPIAASEKVHSDCRANFCVACSYLGGAVIISDKADADSWDQGSI